MNAVAAPHDLDPCLNLLALDGTTALVDIPAERHPSPLVAGLIAFRRSLAGSLVGSLAETQEFLDFCAEHNVLAQVETIPIDQIGTAYE